VTRPCGLWLTSLAIVAPLVATLRPPLGVKPFMCFESATHIFSFGDSTFHMNGWLTRLELDSSEVGGGRRTARLVQVGPYGTQSQAASWTQVSDTIVVTWVDSFDSAEWRFVVDDRQAIGWAGGTTDEVQLDSTGVYRRAEYRRPLRAGRVQCH
jgi:hypothetical protein